VTNPFEPQEVRTHRTMREYDLDEAFSADLFDTPGDGPDFGPIVTADYDSDDGCCGNGIEAGQQIRGIDGSFIHATEQCEAFYRD